MNSVSDSERLKLPVVGDAPNSHRMLFFSKPENAPLTQSGFPTGAGSILNYQVKQLNQKGFMTSNDKIAELLGWSPRPPWGRLQRSPIELG